MKTGNIKLILSGAIIMLISSAATVGATEDLDVTTIDDTRKIRMELNEPAASTVNVILYNSYGTVVYDNLISEGATFDNEIDFSDMRRGTYKLSSKVGNLKYNRIIEVTSNSVELTDSYYTMLPQITQKDGKLMVHMPNIPESTIGVSIEDSNGSVVNDYYYEPGETFSIVYSLKNLSRDIYTIRLLTDTDVFVHEFKVEATN